MTTRFNVPYIEGKEQQPTGYDLQNNDPSTYYIPSCGIEDVDTAMHALFDKDIPFRTYQAVSNYEKEINIKKPFVVLATGERFALAKRLKPFRDRAGVLLLPAISIRRTTIEQASGDTFVGELTIKRRLDASDKDYQSLINRLLLNNVPKPPDTTRADKGENQNDPSIREGMLLDDRTKRLRADHIYEIIAIPFPQFFTVTYEIVFWTNYTQHMNYMLETMLASQITPGKGFYLKSDKGYWFSATVDSGLSAQDNFDDITDQERLVKYSFNINVRGYLLAPSAPGQKVPFKRYLSNVNISFETYIEPGQVVQQNDIDRYNETKNDFTKENPFVLTDIEQDPATKQKPTDQEKLVFERTYRDPTNQNIKQTKYVKQMANNQKQGETVYTASDQQALFDFFADNE